MATDFDIVCNSNIVLLGGQLKTRFKNHVVLSTSLACLQHFAGASILCCSPAASENAQQPDCSNGGAQKDQALRNG